MKKIPRAWNIVIRVPMSAKGSGGIAWTACWMFSIPSISFGMLN